MRSDIAVYKKEILRMKAEILYLNNNFYEIKERFKEVDRLQENSENA